MSRLMKLRHHRDALARRIDGIFLGHSDAWLYPNDSFAQVRRDIVNLATLNGEAGRGYLRLIEEVAYVTDDFGSLVTVQVYARMCLLVARAEWKHVKCKPSYFLTKYNELKQFAARRHLWNVYIYHNPDLSAAE